MSERFLEYINVPIELLNTKLEEEQKMIDYIYDHKGYELDGLIEDIKEQIEELKFFIKVK